MFDILWELQLHQAGQASALAVADGHVVVHARRTRLLSIDPLDGSVRWDVPVGTWPRNVVISGRRCFVLPQQPAELICFDLVSGHREWVAPLSGFVGNLAVSRETVLAGGWRGYCRLTAFDVATGQVRWATGERIDTVLPLPVDDGFLIGVRGGTTVQLIDRLDGSTRPVPYPLGPDLARAFSAPETVGGDGRSAPIGTGLVTGDHHGCLALLDQHGAVVERARVTQRIRALRPLAPGRVLVVAKGTLLAVAVR